MSTINNPQDPVDEKVELLVPAAKGWAIVSFQSVDKEFHLAVDSSNPFSAWDFFVTVGGVTVAVFSLFQRFPEEKAVRLFNQICKELDEWDVNGSRALEDCRAFIARSLQGSPGQHSDVTPKDALGMWVLWNIYGRCPSDEEAKPARAIGGMLEHAFSSWWD